MGNATVNYSFNNFSITMDIVVNTQVQMFKAMDNKTYPGYAIISGSGNYSCGRNKYSFQVAPQSVNPFNVLWASSGAGSGGSSHGIDQYGISILRDDGNLVWNGPAQGISNFWFQEGAANGSTTLTNVANWPPQN